MTRSTSAIDTNVFAGLWDKDEENNLAAQRALDAALRRGRVVASGAVYAELLGAVGRSVELLGRFFDETGIELDWTMNHAIWERAGMAYQGYVARRKRRKDGSPRHILTDFLIGAHASVHGYTLLTLDNGIYRAAFPEVTVMQA